MRAGRAAFQLRLPFSSPYSVSSPTGPRNVPPLAFAPLLPSRRAGQEGHLHCGRQPRGRSLRGAGRGSAGHGAADERHGPLLVLPSLLPPSRHPLQGRVDVRYVLGLADDQRRVPVSDGGAPIGATTNAPPGLPQAQILPSVAAGLRGCGQETSGALHPLSTRTHPLFLVDRGLEMIAAVEGAERLGCPVIFADRSDATFKRRLEEEMKRFYPQIDAARVYNLINKGKSAPSLSLPFFSPRCRLPPRLDLLPQPQDRLRQVHEGLPGHHPRARPHVHPRPPPPLPWAARRRHHWYCSFLSCSHPPLTLPQGRTHLAGVVQHWDRLEERLRELEMKPEDLVDALNTNPVAALPRPAKAEL